MKHLDQFIINAGKIEFTTSDGSDWRMRQPTPDEAASGDSAYRLTYERVTNDKRLKDLAGNENALIKEARIRAIAAEVAYLLPLLLEKLEVETWVKPYNPYSEASLEEFDSLPSEIIAEMSAVYLGPIREAIKAAGEASKKKNNGTERL